MIRIIKALAVGFIILLLSLFVFLQLQPTLDDLNIPYAEDKPADKTVSIKWFGVSTLLIDDGETQIMTDGFFSRPSLLDIALERPLKTDEAFIQKQINNLGINRLKAIMPVHSHYDHALDTAVVAELTGAQVYGSHTTANLAKSEGLNDSQITVVETSKAYKVGDFTLTFYESKHAPLASNKKIGGVVKGIIELPASYLAYQEGKSYALHIKHPDGSLLIQGSAGFVPSALAGVKVDTVFLGAGGLNALPIEHVKQYVAEIVKTTQAKTVYLIHHDDMFHDFGEIKIGFPFISVDEKMAAQLKEWLAPTSLYQMKFAQAVSS